jgi:hypothetical protein
MCSVNFEESGIEEIGDNVTFASYVSFICCEDLKKIGNGVKFMKSVYFEDSNNIERIPEDQPDSIKIVIEIQLGKRTDIPDGTIFENYVFLKGCKNLKRIGE